MAKVLQNFLIGVGLDTEQYDKGAKNVEGSLSRMRTLVGFTGAAITGAFAAAGGAAIAAAHRNDQFMLSVEGLRTAPEYIYAYGRALAAMGGDADNAIAAIKEIEKAQDDLRLKGMLGPLEDVALSGGDISALEQTRTGAEFLRTLAPMVQRMDKGQQGLTQRAIGLSDDVMRSLRGGVDKFDADIARAADLLGGGFQGATEAARDFNRATAEFGTRLQGISDTLSNNILPSFTGVVDSLGGFIDRNRDLIDRTTKDKPEASALVGTSAAAIGAGAAASTIGLRTLGGLAMRGGVAGMAIGAGLIAADMRPDDIEDITGYRPNDYIFDNTPLDAARDAYNAVADKYGFERSEKGSGAISYLEGSYDRLNNQMSDFDSFLRDYAKSGGRRREPESISYLEGSYDRLNTQISDFDAYLHEYARSGSRTQGTEAVDMHSGAVEYVERIPPPQETPYSGAVEYVQPIYYGGEISNSEAASAHPDVITIRDLRQQADRPVTTPRVSVDNNLNIQLEMDGRAIDTRVIDVIERRERDTMDDIYSSVDR